MYTCSCSANSDDGTQTAALDHGMVRYMHSHTYTRHIPLYHRLIVIRIDLGLISSQAYVSAVFFRHLRQATTR